MADLDSSIIYGYLQVNDKLLVKEMITAENGISGYLTGNADSATVLKTGRNISLGGDLSGSALFDGSSDITITATVADNYIKNTGDTITGDLIFDTSANLKSSGNTDFSIYSDGNITFDIDTNTGSVNTFNWTHHNKAETLMSLDETGNLTLLGTVDGVDISSFKSSFDVHNHDGIYEPFGAITTHETTYNHSDLHSHANKITLDAIEEAFTTTQKNKLAGIEDGADVTDSGNVGSSIHGVTEKTTPVDNDEVGIIDSAASYVLKKLTWGNIKSTIKSYFDTLYATIGHNHDTQYLGISAKAADSDKLDGLDSTAFASVDHNHFLNDLSNVNVSAPVDGNVLIWNSAASEWQADDVKINNSYKLFTATANQTNFDISDIYPTSYAGAISVFVNGVYQSIIEDYTVDDTPGSEQIIFTSGCSLGDRISVNINSTDAVVYSNVEATVNNASKLIYATQDQTTFDISDIWTEHNVAIAVFRNGLFLESTEYTVDETVGSESIVINYPCNENDKIVIQLNTTNATVLTSIESILSTKGDIYIHDGSSVTRLPVGTNNQVLTADSSQASGVKWDTFVEDQIVDGITTKAPSQNAVYDALTSKADKNYVDNGLATKIGSVVEDTSPELSGELDAGENTIGFTERSNTSSAGAVTINWTKSNHQAITLTENTTFTFTNPSNPCNLTLRVKQDAVGGRTVTMPTLKTPSGIGVSFSTVANAEDLMMLYFDGVNYTATVLQDIK